ncbi:MAG: Phosphate metabolism transcription protein [Watsoniomyces obsoletus]|nr:MAG: Phosphate metabolism transcription protein [Watsoniomyces obsoletus]
MVLCPFVYLLRGHDPPPLQLQGSEVSSAHWVPLRALLSSSTRTIHQSDISDRLASKKNAVTRWIIRATLGKMIFAAIRLIPSQSVYDTFTPGLLPRDVTSSKIIKSESQDDQRKTVPMSGSLQTIKAIPDQPLILWGITLGIVADFIDLLPSSHGGLQVWYYPTFSAPDVRFWLAILSRRFRKQKEQQIMSRRMQESNEEGASTSNTLAVAVEEGLDAVRSIDVVQDPKTGASQVINQRPRSASVSSWSGLVGFMLHGYWDLVRRAVFVALLTRTLLALAGGGLAARWILWKWASRRRRG